MIGYLIEMSLYWAVFYLLYVCVLRRHTFFQINRWFLLGSLMAGVVFPLIPFPEFASAPTGLKAVWLPVLEIGTTVKPASLTAPAAVAWWQWIWIAGSLLTAARFFVGLYKIWNLFLKSTKERLGSYVLVKTEQVHLPFSFGSFLFWSDRFEPDPQEARQIRQHEEAHIRQRHTLDVILLEMLSILLWWHPLVYAYRHSIREIHEYLADAAVLTETSRKTYGTLLLLRLQPGLQPALANHFLRSQLKSRLLMMTRKPSAPESVWWYLLAIPLVVFLVWACNTEEPNLDFLPIEETAVSSFIIRDTIFTFNPETMEESTAVVEREVYKVVSQMPRFPGCEGKATSDADREACAQLEMLKFVFSNIKYPEVARNTEIEGTVVARFIINADGQVTDPQILRGLGGGCDEEVLRVINEMPQWIPGQVKGKSVAVQYNLPVKFRLE